MGGKDIGIAERATAYKCGIEFPRIEGDTYIGVVGDCGGHTSDYHFHRSFNCLFAASGGHSTKVGDIASYGMYGKWEDYANNKLPLLDACGAHLAQLRKALQLSTTTTCRTPRHTQSDAMGLLLLVAL
eukprot:gb/GFBE01060264.1/.p1 GENE.gb/GFBE01060264.1/~~gb/GFBE01060264.1/.p1  ORF type:complete len:128 (+),score=18.70 gb/GFBE01060264.1/:1-384(+)